MNMVGVAEWFRRRPVEPPTRVQFSSPTPTLLCPHCEKPLGKEHDDAGCRRGMSRRFFFGAMAGGVAAAIAAPAVIPEIIKAMHVPITLDKFWVAKWTAEEEGEWGTVIPITATLNFNDALEFDGGKRMQEATFPIKPGTNWITIEKESSEMGHLQARLREK